VGSKFWLKVFGLLSIVILIFICQNLVLNLPAESQRVGPISFDSKLENGSSRIFASSTNVLSSDIQIRCRFLVTSRPSEYSVLFSTGRYFPEGLNLTLDKYGNLYLQIESVGEDPYQLIFVSGPFDLDVWQHFELKLRESTGDLAIAFNGIKITVNEARDGKILDSSKFLMRTNAVTLGGVGEHQFDGVIKRATFVMGTTSGPLDLKGFSYLLILWLLFMISRLAQSIKRSTNLLEVI
jgi:hypothetical protein